jgi:uncharacterized membrane protein YkvA (DUF1232 family)
MEFECPIPQAIPQERRNQIRCAYQDAVATVGHREDQYVQDHLERLVTRLYTHGGPSSQLAQIARALGRVYFLEGKPDRRISDPGRRYILAALHYLCEPFDVVPDFRTSGYVDDALVINQCLSVLRTRWRDLYRSVLEAA